MTKHLLNLVPYPQKITREAGFFPIPPDLADQLSQQIIENPEELIHHSSFIIHHLDLAPEAYRLTIAPTGIIIAAPSPQGRYYALQTLRQLASQFGAELPAMTIEDAPALPIRGVMLDVSRGKVPTLETLKGLVERLASIKINQLQLYVEHTFAFARHPLPGAGHSPLTREDIVELDAHCRRHHIALVPNLQSFGHLHGVLRHERYRGLAESDFRGGWTLSPAVPEVYDFLAELYAEYLPLFSHRPYFNVGCDETWDLGKGRTREAAEARGVGRVYLEHLLAVRRLIEPYGCRMAFWGDILERHPELTAELPRDVVLLNWFYDAHGLESGYAARSRPAREAGLEHWVCPGTSAWLSFFFRKNNTRDNIAAWANVARETGASGYLVTDWGDARHLNCLSYSYWSFAWAADQAWGGTGVSPVFRITGETPVPQGTEFDRRFFAVMLPGAPAEWGEVLDLLGNQYLAFGGSNGLPNMVHRALLNGEFIVQDGRPAIRFFYERIWPMPSVGELMGALEISEKGLEILDRGPLAGELELVRREWRVGAALGACACRRGLAFYNEKAAGTPEFRRKKLGEALTELEQVWLARNRISDWEAIKNKIEND